MPVAKFLVDVKRKILAKIMQIWLEVCVGGEVILDFLGAQ